MTTPTGPEGGAPEPGLDAVMGERRQLINLAYRLLGSLADAEDAVQETYARWYALPRPRSGRWVPRGSWTRHFSERSTCSAVAWAYAGRSPACPLWRAAIAR